MNHHVCLGRQVAAGTRAYYGDTTITRARAPARRRATGGKPGGGPGIMFKSRVTVKLPVAPVPGPGGDRSLRLCMPGPARACYGDHDIRAGICCRISLQPRIL